MKLIIPKEIEERIHGYVMSVDSEIAGMGKVRVEGDEIIVEEVMIYEQTVTGATADLSPQAIAKWQTELVRAGKSPKNWKLWWHSHDNMPAFFSKRDTDTIDGQTEGDWLLSLVVNKRKEREARLDMYRPFRMYMDKLDIEIEGAEKVYVVPTDIAEEVALKVKRPAPVKYMGFMDKTDLHMYCPMRTTGNKKCYHPYGKLGTDCTRLPKVVDIEDSQTLVEQVKMLERQVAEFENAGLGDSAQCIEVSSELVDTYYTLAECEADDIVAEELTRQAQKLEEVIYNLTPSEIKYD